jgi:hypothetical protein
MTTINTITINTNTVLPKARITVRPSSLSTSVYTMLAGKTFAVVSNVDIKTHGSLMGYAEWLRSIDCGFSADKVLACIKVG